MVSRSRLYGLAALLLAGVVGLATPTHVDAANSAKQSRLESTGQDTGAKSVGRGLDHLDSATQDLMRKQTPLAAAADKIQTFVSEHSVPGFAGVVLRAEAGKLLLYWRGRPPDAVMKRVADLRQSGMTIELRDAPYSLATLDAEQRRLMDADPRVTYTAPLPDFSGLMVGVEEPQALSNQPQIESTVPIQDKAAPKMRELSRPSDSEPFWGGAMIRSSLGTCTSGFRGRRQSNGQQVMVTAQHCGRFASWRTFVSDVFIGTSDGGVDSLDAMVIVGRRYDGVIYVGPWDSNSGRVINGHGSSGVGTVVCLGGAFTGEDCNNSIIATNAFVNVEGRRTGPGIITNQTQGLAAAGPGDSGGPVYRYDQFGGVIIHAMIDAGDRGHLRPCRGAPLDPPRTGCSQVIFSVNAAAIRAAYDLNIP